RRLQDAGLEPQVFDQFSPEPSDFECFGGLEAAKEHEADLLIGVGGGSSMDMAKVVGTLMTNGGGPLDYAGMDLIEHPLPPVITVPTTAGTGSEVTAFAVVTDTPNRVKVNLVSPHLAPKLALLDPMLTVTMPAHVTAATGLDAFCHAFESYTCQVANPITEGLALYAMELIGRYLTVAVEDGGNTEARTKMQLASTIAGLAFSNSDCCGVHCMGESLGGMVDMLHGVACAIFLPPVFEFNMSADLAKHARVGEVLGLDLSGLSLAEAAHKTLDRLIQWEADLGIPHLRDVPGVHPDEFDLAAQGAVESVCASSQPRPTSHADYRRMFEEAYSLESSGPSSPSIS
ncbi:MAG: iron-containing alcohol dehydrogenase, partial [Candidatus Bipolaricaulia bacterium]